MRCSFNKIQKGILSVENLSTKKKILAISGPTAVGKTALAIRVAEELGGEIISCDSMQIYKGMDIGTAKPTKEELARVPHHMLDVVSPDVDFSCAEYKAMATEAIEDIISRGKLPIFCGGTGLYLESVLYNGGFSEAPADKAVRERLAANTPEENWKRLIDIDPDAAAKTHMNNLPRVIRALEIYDLTGITKTEWDRRSKEKTSDYDSRVIVLYASDRNFLYDRINHRVDIMIDEGLVEEVRALSLKKDSTAGQAIGYKEITEYFEGKSTLEEAIEKIKQASRNYAKRQQTWWRHSNEARFVDICDKNFENIVNFAISLAESD